MNSKYANVLMGLPFALLLFILPFPGTVALRLLCLSAMVVIAAMSWRRLQTPSVPIKAALFIWAVVAVLSLGYAVDRGYSFGELKNELGYTMLAFFAFFAMTQTRGRLQAWALSVLAAVVAISLWALAVRHGRGAWDDSAGHGGVGSFASLAVVAAPLGLLIWQRLAKAGRALMIAAYVLMLLAAVASEQRILWVVFGVQLAMVLALLCYSRILRIRAVTLVLLLMASLMAGGAALLLVHGRKVDQSPAEYYDLSNDFRLQQWRRILDRIEQKPWTGAGFGREAMKKAYPDLVPETPPMSLLWHPHNVFLTWGVGMGVPGMLSLVLVFAALALAYARHLRAMPVDQRIIAITGMAIIAGVVVRNLTNDLFLRDGALMFWALNGALLGYLGRQPLPREGGA